MATTIEIPATPVEVVAGGKLVATPTEQRRHDLDALRAIAMLLGIVLHAALAFAPIPWTVSDSQQSEWFVVLFSAIHGFRMPLFFLISGFFTAMLWRKRGLGGLIKQRSLRIALPLFLGCLTIVPAMWMVSSFVSRPTTADPSTTVFEAVVAGDVETVREALESQTLAIDALHPSSRATLLTSASFSGETEMVEMLLSMGADVNQRNGDGGTALHVAVFMGRAKCAARLLEAGADAAAQDNNGATPADNLAVDFGTTSYIAQMYGETLVEEELNAGRVEIAQLMGVAPAGTAAETAAGPGLEALYGLFFLVPAFMHLWFLAFLCWLVVGFVGYALVAQAIPLRRIPKWLFCSPMALLWLVPLTMLPQHFMSPTTYGPDTSVGLLPIPSVLMYYAVFFFFGAVYWELDDSKGLLGHWWYVTLPLGLFIVFPFGLEVVSGTFGFLGPDVAGEFQPLLGNFLQALFVWLMVFGSIGMFRALLSRESKTMRYISDSSYWLYLVHLPLVILAQWFVKDWPLPATVKCLAIIVVVTGLLLLTYEYLIRYTIIGTMLNGPRRRERAAQAA